MEAVKIENLSFRYPETGVDVLKNISLTVNDGEFITLCGASGSGKTTLLRQLKPSLAPHGVKEGSIYFYGRKLDELSLREQSEGIGFVSQSPENQIVTDKVWHELAFGLESLGLPNDVIRRRVAETASFFGIEQYFDSPVSELSGGMKQLLNLASVMAMQPKVLILDEPTSQLDPITAADFLGCLSRINRELGTTVIITEHRLEDVLPISDRVWVIDDGVIISDETPGNTGKRLKELNSGFFESLPSPMRIWNAVSDGKGECPVTVAQGREWLCEFSKENKLYDLPDEEIPEAKNAAVSLKDFWFRYEKDSPDVLKGLNLEVKYGEFLAIMGGNGTGKSTLLSLIQQTNKPYRGKVFMDNALCLSLPQNPQTLLSGKTVRQMLCDVFDGKGIDISERDKRLNEIVSLCGLTKLLERHPFDLSGGEMQRAALAKLLLLQPKILLLDEPTKGLDAQFKSILANIIGSLVSAGAAVVMISHDVEFCARYSHRCALLFNGELVASGTPRNFFSNNSFYVTSASRMSRGIIKDAVTAEDVIYCCTGKKTEPPVLPPVSFDGFDDPNEFEKTDNKKMLPAWKKALGGFGLLLLVFGVLENLDLLPFLSTGQLPLWGNLLFIFVPVVILMITFGSLSKKPVDSPVKKSKLSKRTVASMIMVFLLIPLTIWIGNVILYDQKYLFISLLVLLECMLPFFLAFEGRKPQARELVLIAVLCALAIAGRSAFAALPQIKPVLALVIISGVALGGETGFIVGAVTMLVSNIYFGQGAWTPWQMFAAGLIGLLAGVLFQKGLLSRNRGALCVFGFIVTILIYGGVMNFSSIVLSHAVMNRETVIAFYVQGLPFDIIHALSTAVFLFFLAEPMLEKLDRVKTKYGLIQ